MDIKFKKILTKGMTISELLVVLGILVVLVAIVLGAFTSFRKNSSFDNDIKLMMETLREARSQTLSSQNASQYGVHFENTKITLFVGDVYSVSNSTNRNFDLSSTDISLAFSLNGGGNDIVFKRLTGGTAQSGTITISSPSLSKTKIITIYRTGLIESQ